MQTPPLPVNEAARLELLRACQVLDTPPETEFDDVARLAKQVCSTPMAVVTLIDEERQWFKAREGLEVPETPREIAFCAHTIVESGVFVVRDSAEDPRFAKNPMVVGEPFIRFYAGARLLSEDELALGTVAVLDTQPRNLTPSMRQGLEALARQVTALLEARRKLAQQRRSLLDAAEEALSDSEARFQVAFEHAPQGIALVAADGRFLKVNRAWTEIVGFSAGELEGETFQKITAPEDRAMSAESLRGLVSGERDFLQLEKRYRHKEGNLVDVALNVAAVRDSRGRVQTLISQIQDITARKEAERALRSSEERYRTLAESSPVGIWQIGPEGYTVYANPAMYRMLELDGPEQLRDRTFRGFFTPESLAVMEREHGRRSSGEASSYEVELVGEEGRHLLVLISGAPLFGENGSLSGLIGTFLDVTESRELEDRLRQLQKMESIGQLAAGVAHDFNNILTIIHGEADLLRRRVGDSDDLAPPLERVVEAAQQASGLTRQLLLFGRREKLSRQMVDVGALVEGLGRMLSRLLGGKVELETLSRPRLPPVEANPEMLEQAVFNLVVNARDAVQEGGRVSLGVGLVEISEKRAARNPEARAGRFVEISVADDGAGIQPELLEHVFEPFFTTKAEGDGTGLGLATVYGIVKQHGGWIEVESEPGRGTRFDLLLPVAAGEPVWKHAEDRNCVSTQPDTGPRPKG